MDKIRLKDLELDTEVKFGGMVWIIRKKNKDANTVTLVLKESIPNMEYDAAEPKNQDVCVVYYGNNIYALSNIRQWLNSKGKNWYANQHEYDAAPSYAGKKGFLSKFGKKS